MNAKNVATEILHQLGGNKFICMTGAKKFAYLEKGGLIFRLPSDFANFGINLVKIELDPSDTYNVYFYKSRGVKLEEIKSMTMIYCDQLQDIFTQVTGLYTYL